MRKSQYQAFSLDGRTALITGAAGLLGAQHASALLESGARVILTDLNEDKLLEKYSILSNEYGKTNIVLKAMDVTSQKSVKDVATELGKMGILVNILINNAAIDPKVGESREILESSRLENFQIDQWNLQIAVGLTGAFICSQVFGGLMAKNQKGGVILNIASDLSVIAPDQRLYRNDSLSEDLQPVKPITYSVIKAGLVGLTRYLATYWTGGGVRCNALSPGGVVHGQNEEFVARLKSLIPMGRMAQIDEYRSAIQFLCSDASNYMNGQNIIMDGGRSVW